jgi:glycerate kinase
MTEEKDSFAHFLTAVADLCAEVAGGRYDNINRLFDLTGDDHPAVAELAEAFGMMVVQLEAREYDLDQTVRDLRETKRQLEAAQQQLSRENADLK